MKRKQENKIPKKIPPPTRSRNPTTPVKTRLLMIDDDDAILSQLKWSLGEEYEVFLASNRKSAVNQFRRERPPVVTLDLGLPPHPRDATEGLLTLSEILTFDPHVKVIIVSGNSERQNALKALEQGAYDFFEKPIQLDELRIILKRAMHVFRIEEENRQLKKQPLQMDGMIGTSEIMEALYVTIRKVADTDIPVLITGESGTGKELVAKSIHHQSARNSAPFVTINCGAIPENLLESELFGHEKGAFTGAHARKKGKFEFAEGGTLFLDEIGELALSLQVKLLRFLQENTIERIGGSERVHIDARILAATNRDLDKEVAGGAFREDLFYRLGGLTLSVPPLRERRSDILLLAQTFVSRYCEQFGKKVRGLTPESIVAITEYTWPGNVRELENRIRRGVTMAEGIFLTPGDLDFSNADRKVPATNLKKAREEVEQELIAITLARFEGNISQAAIALGISRPTLHDLLKKYQIKRMR